MAIHVAIPQPPTLCICQPPARKSKREEGPTWHRLLPAFFALVFRRQRRPRICLQDFPQHKTSRSTSWLAQLTFCNHSISSIRVEPAADRILPEFFDPIRRPV